ncbi:MAG: M28 family metallopeptidase [Syntrophales bacterium LBB04]|nr:M28 family metallopeptidase [Syntrophales bacterium LBB04]
MSGLEVNIHTYPFDNRTWPNVSAKIRGNNYFEQVIMVIAHIDSISDHPHKAAPGGDDDGSGVAALLEIARILRKIPMDRTVIFAAFTNEERGTEGSKSYVRQVRNEGLDIKAVLNLDTLAYNRPEGLFDLKGVWARGSLRDMVKSAMWMVRNYLIGRMEGKDVVKVAGRMANQGLVAVTSKIIRTSGGLKVKEVVDNHCG